MILYIKFIEPDDIYAVIPFYNSPLPPGAFESPRICGRCGETLYIPVELPDDTKAEQGLGVVYRPLPKEDPYLVVRSEPDLPTLSVSRNLDRDELQRLKRFHSMTYVGQDGFAMFISDVSRTPVTHVCEPMAA